MTLAGDPRTRPGCRGDRNHILDEYLECMRRCDRNIAGAEGDAPLQAFWRGEKAAYQSDLSRQEKTATPFRLMALDEGPDILVGRIPVLVGRHPWCDARLDSIRVSRRHCLLAQDDGDVVVRDLGSINGIRINGRRVESGRLRPGDELSIAHLRYRVGEGRDHEAIRTGFSGDAEVGPSPGGALVGER